MHHTHASTTIDGIVGKGGGGGDMHTQWNGRPVDRPRIRRSALPCQLYASRIWRVEFETKVRKGTQINARQIKGTHTRTLCTNNKVGEGILQGKGGPGGEGGGG